MRALIVPERGRLEMADIPKPEINDYQALVKVEVCGICSSTDRKIIDGQMTWAGPFPLVLGHESVGTVVQVGGKVRNFRLGDRVTRVILPKTPKLNAAMGGFAEFGIVTDARAMAADGDDSLLGDYNAQRQQVVPSALTPLQASLAISLSETASVLSGLPQLRGRRVLVAGTGIAGLALTLWTKLAGAIVITLGRRESRLALARTLGADHAVDTTRPAWPEQVRAVCGPTGADGALEAIGDVAFARQLLSLLKPNAFAVAYGAPAHGLPFGEPWTTPDVREQDASNWVNDLLLRQWIPTESLISHTWQLDEAPQAFDQVRRGDVLKGFIRIG